MNHNPQVHLIRVVVCDSTTIVLVVVIIVIIVIIALIHANATCVAIVIIVIIVIIALIHANATCVAIVIIVLIVIIHASATCVAIVLIVLIVIIHASSGATNATCVPIVIVDIIVIRVARTLLDIHVVVMLDLVVVMLRPWRSDGELLLQRSDTSLQRRNVHLQRCDAIIQYAIDAVHRQYDGLGIRRDVHARRLARIEYPGTDIPHALLVHLSDLRQHLHDDRRDVLVHAGGQRLGIQVQLQPLRGGIGVIDRAAAFGACTRYHKLTTCHARAMHEHSYSYRCAP